MADGIKNPVRDFKQIAIAAKKAARGLTLGLKMLKGENSKISNLNGGFMFATAVTLDALQALVGLLDLGTFSGPIALVLQYIIFTPWFRVSGVSYWDNRVLLSKILSSVAELIPGLNDIVPGATINVLFAIGIIRFEEAGQEALDEEENSGGAKNPAIKQAARNKPVQSPQTGAGVLNAQRTPQEKRARLQQSKSPEREVPSTPKGGVSGSNVVNLKGQEVAKAA